MDDCLNYSLQYPYNDAPRLVVPNNPFYYSIGNNNQSIRALVYQNALAFGDPLPLDLAGLTLKFNLYDDCGTLILRRGATISNLDLSEIEFKWSKTDIINPGTYTATFEFKDLDDSTFILPELRQRIQIIAR